MKTDFNQTVAALPPSGIRKFFELVIGADDIISLGVGEPDFATPWKIREEVYHTLEKGRTTYTSNWGLLSLREAISEYYQKRINITYDPKSEILITVGVSEAIDLIFRAMLNAGDEIIIPEPAYVSYMPVVTMAGGVTIPVDTSATDFSLTCDQLEAAITKRTKALFLTYPVNPTGKTIQPSELVKIAQLAEKHDLWVVTDEIYGDLTYEGTHTPFSSLEGMKKRTIMLNGFSKAHAMTGWRLGYMCGPTELVSLAVKIHQYTMLCAPIMSQYAAQEAILNCADEAETMKKSYFQRRNLFIHGMKQIGLPLPNPEGAFYAFPSIKSTGLTSEEFAIRLLKEQKVAVVPGPAFGACGEGHIRCCYATDINDLKEAIKRIGLLVQTLT